jgi:hypothetical protein
MVMSQSRELQQAVKRAVAAAHKNEMARQLDAMRREISAPKEDQRIIRFACAVTGKKFAVVYKRGGPADLYRIATVESDSTPAHAGAPPQEPVTALQTFALTEFDQTGWRCPWCSAGNFVVNCGCGDNVCNGRTRTLPNGDRQFTCHDACRRSFSLTPAREVYAEDRKPAAGRRSIEAPPARIALPNAGKRR